jgi:hypothetical protein
MGHQSDTSNDWRSMGFQKHAGCMPHGTVDDADTLHAANMLCLQVTPCDKNCKCCYDAPAESSSCLMSVGLCADHNLYFKNNCGRPLDFMWVNYGSTWENRIAGTWTGKLSYNDPLSFKGKTVKINPK